MSKTSRKEKDAAMAAYMKQHPGSFPDSVKRPWQGDGAGCRALARQMGSVPNNTAAWLHAMRGGVAAARLGLGESGIPDELLARKAA